MLNGGSFPREIVARYELTTPAFAAGARPSVAAELRVEAIVGQLRRWHWARDPLRRSWSDNEANLRAKCLFGAGGGSGGEQHLVGQGAFLLTLTDAKIAETPRAESLRGDFRSLFGPLWGGKHSRLTCLWSQAGSRARGFELTIRLRPPPKHVHPERPDAESLLGDLLAALKLWGLLGGFGAAQRRGFGSLSLVSLKSDGQETWTPPLEVDAYVKAVKAALGSEPRADDFQSHPGSGRAFASFRGGPPDPEIWLQSSLSYSDAEEALQSLQRELGIFSPPPFPGARHEIIHCLAVQAGNNRHPSPFHFHVARIGERFALALSVLPSGVANAPPNAARILNARNPDSLVSRLGLDRKLPAPQA